MSEIRLSALFSQDGSISDIHSPTKVYTFCQYGALFTKCTIM